jgi:DNA-binding LytR/AlgR family response regulator
MINIAIVEDELEMQTNLNTLLDKYFKENNIEANVKIFNDASILLHNNESSYSLIFMDINLPTINGMEAAKKIRENNKTIMIIFITSLAQYALQGYKVNAFDFIVKPFNYYTLSMTLNRAIPQLETKSKSIVIKNTQKTIDVIYLDELLFVEVANHTLYFHTLSKTVSTNNTLEYYEQELKQYSFVACNRCYLVNLKHVTAIDKNEAIVGSHHLLISRYKKKSFSDSLTNYICNGGTR